MDLPLNLFNKTAQECRTGPYAQTNIAMSRFSGFYIYKLKAIVCHIVRVYSSNMMVWFSLNTLCEYTDTACNKSRNSRRSAEFFNSLPQQLCVCTDLNTFKTFVRVLFRPAFDV